mgnify:CR=1 FL=1|jgi:hypothetical protein
MLRLDNSCRENLSWRSDVPPRLTVDAVVEALEDRGFSLTAERAGLVTLVEDATRHNIIMVRSTGRLQVRLHYVTAQAQREAEAKRLGATLQQVFGALP